MRSRSRRVMHLARRRVNSRHSRLAKARAHWPRAMLQEKPMGPVTATHSALPTARACRCSKDRDRVAFYRGKPAARKCNRAARSAVFPIFGRCRKRRNRRGPAGCGNRRTRSPRRFFDRAEPSPISAADKYRSVLRPIADRDGRSANSESGSNRPTRTRTFRKVRRRVRGVLS